MKDNFEYMADKFRKNETVYLLNDYEDIAMKFVPTRDRTACYAKSKGGGAYRVEYTTDLATETRMSGLRMTKEEYDKY